MINFMNTVKGSYVEGFYPEGWDMERVDACCSHSPEEILERQASWHDDFIPVQVDDVQDMYVMLGHEIATEIRKTREADKEIILILPEGPMGMYRRVVYFLTAWNVSMDHCHCFNMDEWADAEGNTLDPTNAGSFQYSMEKALYEPQGDLTVPVDQRNFATKDNLPKYPEKIAALRAKGARMITVYGIGRATHIAFWEPHFAAEFDTVDEWMKETYRLGARLHPLTIEQNAFTSYKSRTGLVSCTANTIGPGLFLQSDRCLGACDGGGFRGGQMWQGQSLWMTLRYGGPEKWVPASFMPTKPGTLFFIKELAGPLQAEAN